MPDKDDHLTSIPSMTPARDEVASYSRNRQPGRRPPTERRETDSHRPEPEAKRGSLWLSLILLLLLGGVGAWAYFLQQQTVFLKQQTSDAEQRLLSLEGRLSSTDQSINQSSVSMESKLKEMDVEVRKLWDNVWKRSKDQLEAHESKLTKLEATLTGQSKQMTQLGADQKAVQKQIKEVKGLSSQLADFKTKHTEQQRLVAELRNQLASLEKQTSLLESRLGEAEEWNDSNLAHRKQVAGRLAEIEKALQTLQSSARPAGSL